MKITIHSGNWEELDIDALAVLQAANATPDAALDARLGGLLGELRDNGEWTMRQPSKEAPAWAAGRPEFRKRASATTVSE